jgi:hypothetical protein
MPMNKPVKIGIVIGGYILALAGASAATYIQELSTRGTDPQASQGMFAFGQSMLFLLVFGGLALIPTVLAVYFLRSSEKFWNGFAVLCLAFSITGIIVVIANAMMNANLLHISNSSAAVVSLFGVLRAFGAPLLIVGFLVLAVIAPSRRPQIFLLASAGLEILGELYVLVSFLLFKRFF